VTASYINIRGTIPLCSDGVLLGVSAPCSN